MTTHIYVDVDGVLNACSKNPWVENPYWNEGRWVSFHANGYLMQFNEGVISHLKDLESLPDVKMFWLTTWTYDAPRLLSPQMGIGADWEVVGGEAKQSYGPHYHQWWKFNELAAHLSSTQPDRVVWIDDDLAHYDARVDEAKVLKIAPGLRAGLEPAHFDRIDAFLESPTP